MKKKIALLMTAALAASPVMAQNQSLEDRVAELEAQNSLNIFSFSGSLTTRYDGFESWQDSNSNQTLTYHTSTLAGGALGTVFQNMLNKSSFQRRNASVLREKFQFNIDAKVSPTINFFSRFTTTKRLNGFVKQGQSSSVSVEDDLKQGNAYVDGKLYLDKAYADVRLPDGNTIFSFGRLPTTDGTPTQFWNAKARMGTYPMLSYNSSLDGFALTYRFDKMLGENSGNQLAARVIYTPFSNYYAGSALTGGGNITAPSEGSSDKMPTQGDAVALQLDYANDKLGFAKSFNVIAQYFNASPFHFNNGMSPLANPTTGSVDPTDFTLQLSNASLTVEMDGIAQTDLDFAATYYTSTVKSKGTVYAFLNGVTAGTSSPSSGYYKLGGYGCVADATTGLGCDSTFNGSILLLSGRYKVGNTYLGAEFVQGSKENFFYDGAAENLTSFYSTPGTGTHAYVTHKFNNNLNARLGYMMQKYEYTGMGYGQASIESDRRINTVYTALRLDF